MSKKVTSVTLTASRRRVLKGALAASALVAAPAYLTRATAATPIKIGIPTAITGGYAILGAQTMRTCKLVKKLTDAKGGVLKRPVEFVFQDTAGDPANCVRKCQEMVGTYSTPSVAPSRRERGKAASTWENCTP